jgi:hypothetical protein
MRNVHNRAESKKGSLTSYSEMFQFNYYMWYACVCVYICRKENTPK